MSAGKGRTAATTSTLTMRILLTGSSGWLGRFLAPLLRQAGHTPFGLDAAPGPHTDMVGSVANAPLVRRLFADYRFDGVIHAAALHKPDIVRYPNPLADLLFTLARLAKFRA